MKNKVQFSQTMTGTHFIKQNDSEISFNVHEMDVEDIRSLLNGVSNIFQSLSSALWKYKLTENPEQYSHEIR